MNDLLRLLIKTFENVGVKILAAFSSVGGWLISLTIFISTYFGEARTNMGYIILAAICFDLGWGIASSMKRKQFVLSQCITKSAMKIAIYLSIFTMICLSEKGLNEDWYISSRVGCAILCAAELWSVCGHILILSPNTPVVRLLSKYLQGEISRKLGIEESKIEEIMNNKEEAK
jgi:hypothetical protein